MHNLSGTTPIESKAAAIYPVSPCANDDAPNLGFESSQFYMAVVKRCGGHDITLFNEHTTCPVGPKDAWRNDPVRRDDLEEVLEEVK